MRVGDRVMTKGHGSVMTVVKIDSSGSLMGHSTAKITCEWRTLSGGKKTKVFDRYELVRAR